MGNSVSRAREHLFPRWHRDIPLKQMFRTSRGVTIQVIRVYDGDTVTLRWHPPSVRRRYNIIASTRLLGIDTPEIRGSAPDEKERAYAAKDELMRLLRTGRWKAAFTDLDKYGRPLVTIVPGNQSARRVLAQECASINEHMVATGFAVRYFGGNKKKAWEASKQT